MPIKDLNAFMRTMSVDAALNALAAHFNNGPPEEDVLFCPGPPPTCGGLLPVAVDLAGRLWRYDVNESQLVMFHDPRVYPPVEVAAPAPGWPPDRLAALEKVVLDVANRLKYVIEASPGAQAHIDRERHRAAGGKSG